jgi:hypothetical protein
MELPLRIHFFGFPGADSADLRLLEYRDPYAAYAAFQRLATEDELADGFYREGDAWRFRHGRFLGSLNRSGEDAASEMPANGLAFQGESLFAIPGEFASFPLLGRIPRSERVILRHFLGREWRGPVYTVAYRCHEDTATAFRALAQSADSVDGWMREWNGKQDTLNWGREIHFQGQDEFRRPLVFWKFSEGVMGFEGCFDPILAQEYAEKMKKTAMFWHKP